MTPCSNTWWPHSCSQVWRHIRWQCLQISLQKYPIILMDPSAPRGNIPYTGWKYLVYSCSWKTKEGAAALALSGAKTDLTSRTTWEKKTMYLVPISNAHLMHQRRINNNNNHKRQKDRQTQRQSHNPQKNRNDLPPEEGLENSLEPSWSKPHVQELLLALSCAWIPLLASLGEVLFITNIKARSKTCGSESRPMTNSDKS